MMIMADDKSFNYRCQFEKNSQDTNPTIWLTSRLPLAEKTGFSMVLIKAESREVILLNFTATCQQFRITP